MKPSAEKCLCIHAIDGYETYKIDDHTIGVRPIWYSVDDRIPSSYPILMIYNDLVIEGEFCNGKFFHPSGCAHTTGYCTCEEQEGITHWMPLPKPPSED